MQHVFRHNGGSNLPLSLQSDPSALVITAAWPAPAVALHVPPTRATSSEQGMTSMAVTSAAGAVAAAPVDVTELPGLPLQGPPAARASPQLPLSPQLALLQQLTSLT